VIYYFHSHDIHLNVQLISIKNGFQSRYSVKQLLYSPTCKSCIDCSYFCIVAVSCFTAVGFTVSDKDCMHWTLLHIERLRLFDKGITRWWLL